MIKWSQHFPTARKPGLNSVFPVASQTPLCNTPMPASWQLPPFVPPRTPSKDHRWKVSSLERAVEIRWFERLPENFEFVSETSFATWAWWLWTFWWRTWTARAGASGTFTWLKGKDDGWKLLVELVITNKQLTPDVCNFFWWILEPWAKSICSDYDLIITVENCNPQGSLDGGFHQFTFCFKRVLFAWAIKLGTLDGRDRNYGQCWILCQQGLRGWCFEDSHLYSDHGSYFSGPLRKTTWAC